MNFKDLFEDVYNQHSSNPAITKSTRSRVTNESFQDSWSQESASTSLIGPQEEYILQSYIRPIYGKQNLNTAPIGTHPDFVSLQGTNDLTRHYSCTMFMDIKGSTRLSLLYDLNDVFRFKNAVIQTCVEVVRSFDGYVHRLMGDAVMSFFGSKGKSTEDSIADAVNCATTLKLLLEQGIKPWMESHGFDAKDFGFRVGIDFGKENEVLWGSFGYSSVGEVSATGLSVDMASKLQSRASKNSTMLGQGLLDHVFWPDYYSKFKQKTVSGTLQIEPVVVPNITTALGKPLDYRMKELDFEHFLEVSALPRQSRASLNNNIRHNPDIEFQCFVVENGVKNKYVSASRYLDKHLDLTFEVKASTRTRLQFPLTVKLVKTNFGPEVPNLEDGKEQEKSTRYLNVSREKLSHITPPYVKIEEAESTSYRGLHTMRCEIYDKNNNLVFKDWIGVMIK
ncbi:MULTISPECIES: adenylate/guanylate cyclase domain-containing protein [Vibrio]|uniref:adenylate/guanylate cyclase domain-containing protein n=1 Tax=Vibrio TaxID=662 RepID=UPI0026584255|nr:MULTISPECIES: adenylate/guanylate cyclase domain-containing protein [Vibrio]MCR9985561.1 adenylate/guanylate cyclase domain-containing protein [Vibrio antiquarius]MDW1645246.1 adenylate/guanylate cyclase domain-containing protein [Vibrio sp. Vb2976]